MMVDQSRTLAAPREGMTPQLVAIATYPNLDTPTVDLVYQIAPGRYRLHEMVSNESPAGEGEEVDGLELMQWAAVVGENVVMVGAAVPSHR